MNTILTILLLIALAINIVCDIVRLWTFCRTVEESKENVKRTICDAVDKAVLDWLEDNNASDDIADINDYFRNNFDKYL